MADPCELQFRLLATRRYMLDNELTISELVPGAAARPSLQNAMMPYCTDPYDCTGCQIMDFGGMRYAMTANRQQQLPVYAYPTLDYCGELDLDFKPFNQECPNGRMFMAFAETLQGSPWRYILLTMDRQNFPGMPDPNLT